MMMEFRQRAEGKARKQKIQNKEMRETTDIKVVLQVLRKCRRKDWDDQARGKIEESGSMIEEYVSQGL